jgi:hypothetical protein
MLRRFLAWWPAPLTAVDGARAQAFYGCTVDKSAPKAYKAEAAECLFNLSYDICKKEGIKLPAL